MTPEELQRILQAENDRQRIINRPGLPTFVILLVIAVGLLFLYGGSK